LHVKFTNRTIPAATQPFIDASLVKPAVVEIDKFTKRMNVRRNEEKNTCRHFNLLPVL
jgi:hypothetical protein